MIELSPSAGTPAAGSQGRPTSLRLGAYLLLGDPAYLEQCIRSIYAIAERIVVVYDEAGLSWTNRPLPVEHCLSVVERVDSAGEGGLAPGHLP